MSIFPAGTDVLVNPLSTDVTSVVDHAANHTNANNAIMAIESNMGTNSGTNIHKNFVAGNFPSRINSANVLQQNVQGTINNSVLGTPAITGGTISVTVFNNAVLGTPAITGGTATTLIIDTPTIRAWNGWEDANDTWTMLGTSAGFGSFSVTAGATTKYDKGDKVKFTQGGSTMYAYISAVNSGTVTILSTINYTLSTGAITAPFYSKEQSPNGFPTFMAYLPTYTGGTITPSANNIFNIQGGLCTVYPTYTPINSNSGTLTFTGPIAAGTNDAGFFYGVIAIVDNGSFQNGIGVYGVVNSSQLIRIGKTIDQFASNAFASFTTSGQKGFQGVVQYSI